MYFYRDMIILIVFISDPCLGLLRMEIWYIVYELGHASSLRAWAAWIQLGVWRTPRVPLNGHTLSAPHGSAAHGGQHNIFKCLISMHNKKAYKRRNRKNARLVDIVFTLNLHFIYFKHATPNLTVKGNLIIVLGTFKMSVCLVVTTESATDLEL